MLDIVSAIRKICEAEHGFEDLFDKNKSYGMLCDLVDNKHELSLATNLFYGKARNSLIELINDVYKYLEISEKVINDLVSEGLTVIEAKEALEIFYRAFGFPGYRDTSISTVSEFVSYEKEKFQSIYKGETKDGKEYGVGIRNNYYDGKSCGWDECVWINGRMFGYCHSLDIEFEAYETKKYGFVVNDTYIGKYMNIYEDGEEGYMNGVDLNLK